MASQRRYTSLTSDSSGSFYKILIVIVAIILIGLFFYSQRQIFNELREISAGQKLLIKTLNGDDSSESGAASLLGRNERDFISRVEFVKYKNETKMKITELTKDLRLVQTRLRLKKTAIADE